MGKVRHESVGRTKSQPAPKPTERKVDEEAEERWRSEGGSQTYDTPDPPISQDTTGNPANYTVNRRQVQSPRRRQDQPGSYQEGYQHGRQDADRERQNAGRGLDADSRGPMEYDRGAATRERGYGGSRFEDQQNAEDTDFRSQGDGSEQSGRTGKKGPTSESKSRPKQKRM